MKEKHVWDIVRYLYEHCDCKNTIPGDILRSVIVEITGIYDTGTTTRALKSLLEADIFVADFGNYKYGKQGKKLLKKFGFLEDDRIDIRPAQETITRDKIKSDIVVSHHADLPELPNDILAKVKKLQKKPEVDFGNAPDNAE